MKGNYRTTFDIAGQFRRGSSFLRSSADQFRELLFPEGCVLCGKALFRAGEARTGLCGACGERLLGTLTGLPPSDDPAPPEAGRCLRCGKPLISERGICLPCRNGPERSFDRALSLFPYTGDHEKLVKSYKFGGARRVGHFYVECLKKGREALGCGKEAVWVPVPPRPGKIKKTGWDQIEHLARLMAGSYKIPVSRCLKRLPSISQKELDREQRRTNLKGRILTVSEAPETVILFDDIYTTGSTLDACAQALKNGGSRRVYGVCLYYDL